MCAESPAQFECCINGTYDNTDWLHAESRRITNLQCRVFVQTRGIATFPIKGWESIESMVSG